jgi:hypothetical protein
MKNMSKYSTFLLSGVFILFLANSCYNDNEEDLYPYTPCDSTNVTYSKTIAPIISAGCNRCHSTAMATGGIITDNYQSLKPLADGGLLWGVTSHAPGFKPMPQDGGKLTDCELAKIKRWINDGAPAN